jgi:cyclopropane fatty-acyl-phospholipid synthase-like methyltransferase/methyltransferase-like protein
MSSQLAVSPSDLLLASYDAVPYGGGAIAATRPDTLGATASLRGLEVPDAAHSRVLDLGCATGGNLLAMAIAFPESSFVGIDLSPRQIATARSAARTIGVENVRFETMSITDVGDTLGTFDYIVSHGVYSWVPEQVQLALLEVIGTNLAPNGIAYVSYNTYPGWHARGMVRDMMLFHDREELPAADRVQRARHLLTTLAHAVPESQEVYAAVLREEIATLDTADDSYFMHEELEIENHPVYFTEFARRAGVAGLQYVAEAYPSLTDVQLTAELRETIRSWSADEIKYEQYLDFARNRTFRRSVLCHAGRSTTPDPSPAPVGRMFLRARCAVDPEANEPGQASVEVFRTNAGVAVTMAHPVVRAALHALIDARPASLPFAELREATSGRLASTGLTLDDGVLAEAMLRCAMVRLVDLTTHADRCARIVSERPTASALARLEARTESLVTSLSHVQVKLSAFDRNILLRLDGTRDREALVDAVLADASRGDLDLGTSRSRSEVSRVVMQALEQFRICGLLVA